MLRIDIRALRQGSVEVDSEVGPADSAFQGLDLTLDGPVRVAGVLSAAGRGSYYWRGEVTGVVRGACRRCLTEVRTAFRNRLEALFSTDPDVADDPGVYPLPEPVTGIDLTEAVREEVGLAAPAFPLCREDCAGLCAGCGADLNQGPCVCAQVPDSN